MAFGSGRVRLKLRLASFTTHKIATKEAMLKEMKVAAMVEITMMRTLMNASQQNCGTSKTRD